LARALFRARTWRRAKLVADYEKASGNTIDLSIVPFVALRQKEVAAITSGRRSRSDGGPGFFVYSLNAWDDKLLDVSDIIETQKSQYNEVVLLRRHLYNNVKTERGYYG
jgi:multiple sugar transport system substrate-binding protein